MKIRTAHCFFEQSGTFKNEFKKMGIPAKDYDIKNDYGETDRIIDLFTEIESAYDGLPSIFDKIQPDDLILAFFPCVMFSENKLLAFRGDLYQQKNDSQEKKLAYNLKQHRELHRLYELITKMVMICIRKNLRLIIENPYGSQHYLVTHWSIKPKYIDKDRTQRGDYYKKPTQFFFVNCDPENNLVFESLENTEKQTIQMVKKKGDRSREVLRSEIHPQYANRFIREKILDEQYL